MPSIPLKDAKCAIYLKADPFMKKDLDTIKQILVLFNEVVIILDRKWQNERYLLNFTERSDIIRHDLKAAGIENFKIVANDVSRYDAVLKEGIKFIAVELNHFSKLDDMYERTNTVKQMVPGVSIVMIPQFSDDNVAEFKRLHDIVQEDSTKTFYKKYMSEYAYIKTKFKLTPKIGITGNKGCDIDTVVEVFREKGYDVIDLRKMIYAAFEDKEIMTSAFRQLENLGIKTRSLSKTKDGKLAVAVPAVVKLCLDNEDAREVWFEKIQYFVRCQMMNEVYQSTSKIVVLVSTLLFELKLDRMFMHILTVSTSADQMMKNMVGEGVDVDEISDYMNLYMPIHEKVRASDWYVDCGKGKDATRRNTNNLINNKLEADF